jgi:hypothetical protein
MHLISNSSWQLTEMYIIVHFANVGTYITGERFQPKSGWLPRTWLQKFRVKQSTR